VAELAESLAKRQETRRIVRLGDLAIADDCSTITINDGQFALDEQALNILARYLKLPVQYLRDCPPDFRAETLKFWRDQKARADVVLESVDNGIVSMFSPGLMMIPVARVGKLVETVFKPEDEIRQLTREEKRFHLDVTTADHKVDVPNPKGILGRPEVGDITEGGIRFLAYPDRVKAPSVSRYFHRLVCTNGMTTSESDGKITITGMTMPEVLASMEIAAEELLSTMDEHLDRYKQTADIPVPGHPVSFAEQLAHEYRLSSALTHAVIEQVRQLPEDGTTVYDVTQAVTLVANQVHAYDTRSRLQSLGGRLAWDTARMIERCAKCERLLVEA